MLTMMIVGVPNVGRSTIINTLRTNNSTKQGQFRKERQPSSAKTGPLPGVTRGLTSFKVCDEPLAYLIDTPGVMLPKVNETEVGLKLALTGAVKDSILGKEVLADYLLFTLNSRGDTSYVTNWGLKEPSDDIHVVLQGIAKHVGFGKANDNSFHPDAAATLFVQKYREGFFGAFTLDSCDAL